MRSARQKGSREKTMMIDEKSLAYRLELEFSTRDDWCGRETCRRGCGNAAKLISEVAALEKAIPATTAGQSEADAPDRVARATKLVGQIEDVIVRDGTWGDVKALVLGALVAAEAAGVRSGRVLAGQSEAGWIRCSERMPEVHDRVLALTVCGDPIVMDYAGAGDFVLPDDDQERLPVSHWMPILPKPTEGGDGG